MTSTTLRIAIDASRTTVDHRTGTEYYAQRLIRELITLNQQRSDPHQLHLYFRDEPHDGLFPTSDHVTQHVIAMPRLWTHLGLARALWRDRPNVSWVPAHALPLVCPGRMVVTVHDLGYKHYPQAHPLRQRLYLDWSTRHSVRRADCVLADSQATADDLQRFYGTDADKVRVVYPGIEAPQMGDMVAVRAKYQLPERYFLFLGTLQPRKNIARITAAYQQWRQTNPDHPASLVLAGRKGWLFDEAWIEGIDGVQVLGYVDEADKGVLYAGAMALVFPSLYEGFGFPVLEAMHMLTPVIASTTSSLPELTGDAALLVDPLDVDAIAAAMAVIAYDGEQVAQLRERGQQQAQCFTWERAARQVMDALEAAAETKNP